MIPCGVNKQQDRELRGGPGLGAKQEEKCKQGYQRSLLPQHLTSTVIHSSLKGDRRTLDAFSTLLPMGRPVIVASFITEKMMEFV